MMVAGSTLKQFKSDRTPMNTSALRAWSSEHRCWTGRLELSRNWGLGRRSAYRCPSPRRVMSKIRVLIADDHAVLRAGLRLLLNSQPDLEVVGEAGDVQEA